MKSIKSFLILFGVFFASASLSSCDNALDKTANMPNITIGENGNWFINGEDTNVKAKGEEGPKGDAGSPGNGISSIELIRTEGLVDFYRITFTDGTTYEFSIQNSGNLFFTITYKNDDGTVLYVEENVFYGSSPYYYYYGETPTKESDDDHYYYVFNGWDFGDSFEGIVNQDLVAVATYAQVSNYYTVTIYDEHNQVIDTMEVRKGTTPEYNFDPIPDYIESNIYYKFNNWVYNEYSHSIYPSFSSYQLKDNLYVSNNGCLYGVEELNGTIVSVQITNNTGLSIVDYYKDTYNNIFVKNGSLDYVDTEKNVIYYTGDHYFKAKNGKVVHFDYVGNTISSWSNSWFENSAAIKKIVQNCEEEAITSEDKLYFDTYSTGNMYMKCIENCEFYASYFQGYAYSYYYKVNTTSLSANQYSFGTYNDSWGPLSIFSTTYNGYGMVMCVKDQNDIGTLYYIDNVWKYGDTTFYSDIRSDDSKVVLLAENIRVTHWEEAEVSYEVVSGNSVNRYSLDFSSGTPVVVQQQNSN